MAYAETRDGKLTGYWYGKVIVEGGKRFRKRFAGGALRDSSNL